MSYSGDQGDSAASMSANPFAQTLKSNKPTLKFRLWEVLSTRFPQGATMQQILASDGPLLTLCPSLKERKNPSGQVRRVPCLRALVNPPCPFAWPSVGGIPRSVQVSSELYRGEKEGHFTRQKRGSDTFWLASTGEAALPQGKKPRQAGQAAASTPTPHKASSNGASPESSAQPLSPKPPSARGKPEGAAGGADKPAPGNDSHTPHWKDASCGRLARSLLHMHASVWREVEGQGSYVDASITGGLAGLRCSLFPAVNRMWWRRCSARLQACWVLGRAATCCCLAVSPHLVQRLGRMEICCCCASSSQAAQARSLRGALGCCMRLSQSTNSCCCHSGRGRLLGPTLRPHPCCAAAVWILPEEFEVSGRKRSTVSTGKAEAGPVLMRFWLSACAACASVTLPGTHAITSGDAFCHHIMLRWVG
jgi:hypothetical protein